MMRRQLGFLEMAMVLTSGLLLLGCSTNANWAAKRAAALNRPREVIYNNDGNEPYLWPTNQSFSIAGFLDMRTTPVLGSQVDTVFYCPISSGFGFLSADIPSADLMLRDLGTVKHMRGKRNVLQDFLDMGTDPVREVVSWCRTNSFEVFVTLRVNDTHDQGTDQTKVGPPYAYPGNALFSPFKIQHPEFLMGSYTNRPPHCNWSAVDFTHGAVRERQFQMCRDICTHYDLDGLDLDFFRHMQLFKSVAMGGTASDAERDMMTDLMRRIRAAAETAGRRRGRPILLSIRVPDSVPYCRDVGIDLEKWLSEGLVDMVMTSGYWRHNPWEYTVDLCRRYNVKCYASLDESRLGKAVGPNLSRQTVPGYRARSMAARRAGMDGVMYFNLFTPAAIKAFMRGNLESMRLDDKSYFVSYRGRQKTAGRYLKGAKRYFVLPELSAIAPAKIVVDKTCKFPIWIGDDIEALAKEDIRTDCELRLDVAVPEGTKLSITVNGHAVTGAVEEGRIQRYPLRLEHLICGENSLEFSVAQGPTMKAVTLKDAAIFLTQAGAAITEEKDSKEFSHRYEMDIMPSLTDIDENGINDFTQSLRSTHNSLKCSNGMLTITSVGSTTGINNSTDGGSWRTLAPTRSSGFTIELRLRVNTHSDPVNGAIAVTATASDSNADSLFCVGTNFVNWGYNTGITLSEEDNSDAFHTFRIAMARSQSAGFEKFTVWRDGVLLADNLTDYAPNNGLNRFLFGDLSSSYLSGIVDVEYARFTSGAYAPVSTGTLD